MRPQLCNLNMLNPNLKFMTLDYVWGSHAVYYIYFMLVCRSWNLRLKFCFLNPHFIFGSSISVSSVCDGVFRDWGENKADSTRRFKAFDHQNLSDYYLTVISGLTFFFFTFWQILSGICESWEFCSDSEKRIGVLST